MKDIITSALLLLAFTVVLGLAYPMAVWSVAQVAFPQQANGSLLVTDGQTIGSELIGQQFTGDKYFHGRLSANNYDAANSGGTNLAPTSKKLLKRITTDAETSGVNIPVDLVTASASGLDPHITPAATKWQIKRIAQARSMSEENIRKLISQNTENRQFGIFGEPRVNVLKLNLALDRR